MRRTLVLTMMLSASCLPEGHEWVQTIETPPRTGDVISAVAAMPECGELRGGGTIRWRAGEFTCGPGERPATGCAWPGEARPRVDVAYCGDAAASSLAHQLCHLCGYEDDVETEACAFRARETMTDAQEPPGAWDWSIDFPVGVAEVIDAVSVMPDCASVGSGGVINWHSGDFFCVPNGAPAMGCAWLGTRPVIVDVAYRSHARDSALAHELCHVCGYRDEVAAEACAVRALQTIR
jgi:hypothetical protein